MTDGGAVASYEEKVREGLDNWSVRCRLVSVLVIIIGASDGVSYAVAGG
jgi:hypothetical protein